MQLPAAEVAGLLGLLMLSFEGGLVMISGPDAGSVSDSHCWGGVVMLCVCPNEAFGFDL